TTLFRSLCNRHYLRLMRSGSPYIKKKRWNEPLNFYVDNNGCFICTSHKTGVHGYPQVRHKGVSSPAHRKVYEEMFGEIKDYLFVLHSCDNRICVDPEHFRTGRHAENMQDKTERNRQSHGVKNGRAKLTEEDVLEMMNLIKGDNYGIFR